MCTNTAYNLINYPFNLAINNEQFNYSGLLLDCKWELATR